mgnify:CR=1 FL=1
MITDYAFKMNEYLTKWDFPDEFEPSSSNMGMDGMNFIPRHILYHIH